MEHIKQGLHWVLGLGVAWLFLRGWLGSGLGLGLGAMCEGSDVKDHPAMDVQLESLILAQNERWRQA